MDNGLDNGLDIVHGHLYQLDMYIEIKTPTNIPVVVVM